MDTKKAGFAGLFGNIYYDNIGMKRKKL